MPDDISFEREKWLADLELRNRELGLKERQQQQSEAELHLKERELRLSAWRSPLIVAIFAAAIAASGNALVAWLNAKSQRELDHSKAESARILEMIKTGDPQRAVVNLRFLLNSGLIADPDLTQKLGGFLATSTPGSLPALPPDGRLGFEESASLSEQTKQSLQTLLAHYFEYLAQIGFAKPPSRVTVALETMEVPNASYANNRIVIDPRLVDDPVVALREYNHHMLIAFSSRPWVGDFAWIESGLADYFACSFLDNPNVGEKAVRELDARRPFIRTLSNQAAFDALAPDIPAAAGEVWGGFFWDIRSKLGARAADSLVASAWQTFRPPDTSRSIVLAFMESLLSRAKERGKETLEAVRLAAIARKIPLPEQSR